MPTALLLTDDLFVGSQISVQLGALATVKSIARPDELATFIGESDVRLLLIDLAAGTAPAGLAFVSEQREATRPWSVLAFGPHVQLGKLESAKRAGCDRVVTRGQMLRDGAKLVTDLMASKET